MEIERYTHPVVELFLNETFVMKIFNDIELVRVQYEVAKNNLEGYSIKFGDEYIPIDSVSGSLQSWPRGMYDEWQFCAAKLFKLRRNNIINIDEQN